MPRELIVPALVMSLAFVFYTLGVWTERRAGQLRREHVMLFWLGIACDSVATEMMFRMIVEQGAVRNWSHTLTGGTALLLMAAHAVWATFTLMRGSQIARRRFHRYSVIVWAVWLVPYLGGMLAGMMRGFGI